MKDIAEVIKMLLDPTRKDETIKYLDTKIQTLTKELTTYHRLCSILEDDEHKEPTDLPGVDVMPKDVRAALVAELKLVLLGYLNDPTRVPFDLSNVLAKEGYAILEGKLSDGNYSYDLTIPPGDPFPKDGVTLTLEGSDSVYHGIGVDNIEEDANTYGLTELCKNIADIYAAYRCVNGLC
jgi:hypothetical protein|nr:MAG TPA: hypothetical protein [Caudoviricetes sp.]